MFKKNKKKDIASDLNKLDTILHNANKEVATEGPLGGTIDKGITENPITKEKEIVDFTGEKKPDYTPEHINKELIALGIEAVETFEVRNPVTGKKSLVTIQRDGTPESTLIMQLANKDNTRDLKDHYLSMYLWERGKESTSMLVDLMRYKGQHTKETRAFKTQMRFDFEMFVDSFIHHMVRSAEALFEELGFEDYRELGNEYINWVKKVKEENKETDVKANTSVRKFFLERGTDVDPECAALVNFAFRSVAEADKLKDLVKKVEAGRLAEKGFGIYIDGTGKPYTIMDKDIDEVIKRDRARVEEFQRTEKEMGL